MKESLYYTHNLTWKRKGRIRNTFKTVKHIFISTTNVQSMWGESIKLLHAYNYSKVPWTCKKLACVSQRFKDYTPSHYKWRAKYYSLNHAQIPVMLLLS